MSIVERFHFRRVDGKWLENGMGMTLREIAEEAGVSIRTVRRVLNEEPHVRREKELKIKGLLESTRYRPNIFGRGLRGKRSGLIGLIAGGLGIEVFTKKLSAIQFEADRRGLTTMLGLTGGDGGRELKFCEEYSRFCDGIIFLCTPENAAVDRLREARTPFVVADGGAPESNVVSIDRKSGIGQVFAEIGGQYENFALVAGRISSNEPRRAAFDEHTENFSGAEKIFIEVGSGLFEDGYEAFGKLRNRERTLVFCYNDRMAAGLLRALSENGADDPSRFGVVGFDNDNFTRYTHKRISTITQSVDELAVKTLDLLRGFVYNEKVERSKPVMTKFINRETTLGE